MRALVTFLFGTFSLVCLGQTQPLAGATQPLASEPQSTIARPPWQAPEAGNRAGPADSATALRGGASLATRETQTTYDSQNVGRYDNLGTGQVQQQKAPLKK